MPYRIVLITGSRHTLDPQPVIERLNHHKLKADGQEETLIVIHGAARGIDTFAQQWCDNQGVQALACAAPWIRGKQAGTQRNKDMVQIACLLQIGGSITTPVFCEAFPGPKSVGTLHCYKLAADMGIHTTVTQVDL